MARVESPRGWLGRRTVLAMAASAIAVAGAADAREIGDLIHLSVVDRDTGQEMRVWRQDGRLFVAGRPGARYGVRVTNNSGGRVLVVMSVDGVNVLTGQTADYSQRGYVFAPCESYDVTGWRKSDAEVAAFTFARLSSSYAARTGRPHDVGVIGIAAFRERGVPAVAQAPAAVSPPSGRYGSGDEIEETVVTGRRAAPSPVAPPSAAAATGSSSSRAAPSRQFAAPERRSEKLGTGHGAREWSSVITVPFERATRYPQLVSRIEYDSYQNLVAIGVIRPPRYPGRGPRPFPGNGYVPDPPGGY